MKPSRERRRKVRRFTTRMGTVPLPQKFCTTYGPTSGVSNHPLQELRICVCTSYSALAEPRAPRHAVAIAALNPNLKLTFLDCVPYGGTPAAYDPFAGTRNIRHISHRFAHRGQHKAALLLDKAARLCSRFLFATFGFLHPVALNTRFRTFENALQRIRADVYIGHNIETLLPVVRTARKYGARAIFDCMEFYSGMGDSQTTLDRQIIKEMEKCYLPECALVLASSGEMADALA